MAVDIWFRSKMGTVPPTDDEGIATRGSVAAQITAALSGFTGGSGGGTDKPIYAVTHSVAGDLALDLADDKRAFAVDLAANVTGLAITNAPADTQVDLRIRFTNSTGTGKTIDFTGEAGIITELDFESVVTVAAGEVVSSPIEYWND